MKKAAIVTAKRKRQVYRGVQMAGGGPMTLTKHLKPRIRPAGQRTDSLRCPAARQGPCSYARDCHDLASSHSQTWSVLMSTLVPSTILLRIALAVIARRIARPTAATPSLTFRMAFRAHLVAALCAMAAPACVSPFNPSNPAASGYALTFNGTFGG